MATISLTLPTAGTVIAAGLHATNYSTLQALANGGIDNNNFASGRIFDNLKIMQGGALDKQALIWNNGATQWQPAYPVGAELGVTNFTVPVSVTATTEATANTVVTAPAVTFDGATAMQVEFYAPYATSPAANQNIEFALYDGAASIGLIGNVVASGDVVSVPVYVKTDKITPSAASHTFSVRAFVTAGTGTVQAGVGGVGAWRPGYIKVAKA